MSQPPPLFAIASQSKLTRFVLLSGYLLVVHWTCLDGGQSQCNQQQCNHHQHFQSHCRADWALERGQFANHARGIQKRRQKAGDVVKRAQVKLPCPVDLDRNELRRPDPFSPHARSVWRAEVYHHAYYAALLILWRAGGFSLMCLRR